MSLARVCSSVSRRGCIRKNRPIRYGERELLSVVVVDGGAEIRTDAAHGAAEDVGVERGGVFVFFL